MNTILRPFAYSYLSKRTVPWPRKGKGGLAPPPNQDFSPLSLELRLIEGVPKL